MKYIQLTIPSFCQYILDTDIDRFFIKPTDSTRCSSILNLLIDEIHYTLAFTSREHLYDFISNPSIDLADIDTIREYLVCCWCHTAKLLEELATVSGICYNDFAFIYNSHFWGRCDTVEKIIVINPVLLYNHPLIMESVLVHELCHLKVPCHNDAFYDLYNSVIAKTGFNVYKNGRTTQRMITRQYKAKFDIGIGYDIYKGIDIIVNGWINYLYSLLSEEQRRRLPLEKIPL